MFLFFFKQKYARCACYKNNLKIFQLLYLVLWLSPSCIAISADSLKQA